ncbi:PA14 domain-containing protein [Rubritalea tangerina]|uniref:PA14 domain-containing protein n=1 Tax=Rubritalea tangerina TaxID=430798 RepID=A0ABW4ZEA8_9BACT
MMKRYYSMALGAVACASVLRAAEDGAQLYKQNCSACHGVQGEGAASGTFPPLAESAWVQGDAARAIQVLLHGLEGPIEVAGRKYNLAMPPQGAMLTDAQIAATLSYVRTQFGNAEEPVSVEEVVAAREWSKGRKDTWKAKELLEHYPLPKEVSPIESLVMEVFHGDWKVLPEFEQLESVAFEEEQDGYFSLRHIKKKDGFGIVWTGMLEVPESGNYRFELDADDGARLVVNAVEVAHVKGTGPMGKRRQVGEVALEKGKQAIRLEYFEATRDAGLSVRWSGPGIKGKQWLSERAHKGGRAPAAVIDLSPKGKEAVLYNNFIAGTTPRAIGVGYPEEVNIAFSTQHCAPEIMWRGPFINGGRHWTGRGQGFEAPMSSYSVSLAAKKAPYRYVREGEVDWSGTSEVQFVGYVLDTLRYPTFRYRVDGNEVREKVEPSVSGMKRKLEVVSPGGGKLGIVLGNGSAVQNGRVLEIDGKVVVQSPTEIVRGAEGYHTEIELKKGVNTFTLTYSWK